MRRCAEAQRRKPAEFRAKEERRKTLAGTLARSVPIQGAQERVVRVVIVATRTPIETHIQRASNAAHWSDSRAQLRKARACTTPLTRQSANRRRYITPRNEGAYILTATVHIILVNNKCFSTFIPYMPMGVPSVRHTQARAQVKIDGDCFRGTKRHCKNKNLIRVRKNNHE